MSSMVIIIIIVAGIALLAASTLGIFGKPTRKKRSHIEAEGKWPLYPYYAMTRNEQALYWHLVKALPDYIVLAQVQASRVIRVKKGENQQSYLNRFNRMSYDFLICHKNSYPLAVIELDDGSHQQAKRIESDNRKNKVLADAGIPLLRWEKNTIPNQETILATIQKIDTIAQQKRQA